MKSLLISISLLILLMNSSLMGQTALIKGTVKDEKGVGIFGVAVAINGKSGGCTTDDNGHFTIQAPSSTEFTLVISHLQYETINKTFILETGETVDISFNLKHQHHELDEFTIEQDAQRHTNMNKIDARKLDFIPTPSKNIESLIKTFAGVTSRNELSSQYSVRGGNFDENLIYVNGIQIYRPLLVRSGQQEGLSFVNSDLVSSVKFSSGGFAAKYGDKLSSVLDIEYKEPIEFGGSAEGSLQGGSVHIEGSPGDHRFTYVAGVRYRTNKYVLSSLNTKGNYQPNFMDFQTYLTYDITEKWEIGFLGNIGRNEYKFTPETQQTEFGTVSDALRLTVFFDGQEVSNFETYFSAISNSFILSEKSRLQWNISAFRSFEDETFDVLGEYLIDELDKNLGSDNFGEVSVNRGVGGYLNHARNYLDAIVYNTELKGSHYHRNQHLEWGAQFQHENIKDQLSEWDRIDSLGYSSPRFPDSVGYVNPDVQTDDYIELHHVLRTQAQLQSNRATAFVQNNWRWITKDTAEFNLNVGIRGNYWNLNNQLVGGPRANFSFKPHWKKDFLFRLSGGVYVQPPFYRELRNLSGELNTNLKAQESYHFVLGSDYNFKAWGRPFKLISEAYYKNMKNVIPYNMENVRIRYFALNNAKAFATGIDLKLNGEFIKGIDSWISLSVMETKEDITGDYYWKYYDADGKTSYKANAVDSSYQELGYISRPTDQRVTASLYFQDYFPRDSTLKMHMTLFFSSGFPFSPPNSIQGRNQLRSSPYRRVDIGFSKQLFYGENNPFKAFKSIWLSLEVFNLLQIKNTISYLWVRDVNGTQYAVPNYLTSRQVNVKLQLKF